MHRLNMATFKTEKVKNVLFPVDDPALHFFLHRHKAGFFVSFLCSILLGVVEVPFQLSFLINGQVKTMHFSVEFDVCPKN